MEQITREQMEKLEHLRSYLKELHSAAVAELGIQSPLRECHLTKADIRALSKYLELPTWEK